MKPEVERYRWLTMTREEDFNILSDLIGTSAATTWKPLKVEWIDDDLNFGKPKSDYPPLGTTPTLSKRGVEELRSTLIESGELLPLASEDYYVYNVTRSVDALDERRSDVVRFDTGRIMMVRRYEFRPAELNEVTIFKVPQLRAQVFVTEPFVKRIRLSGLTGFCFREIWQSRSPEGD